MNGLAAIAVILYLVAFSVPAYLLYAAFGLDTKVQPDSGEQLLALAAAMLFTFAVATIGGVFLRRSRNQEWIELIQQLGQRYG